VKPLDLARSFVAAFCVGGSRSVTLDAGQGFDAMQAQEQHALAMAFGRMLSALDTSAQPGYDTICRTMAKVSEAR
jgi:hypothetical protein